jgi:hypothetical protein
VEALTTCQADGTTFPGLAVKTMSAKVPSGVKRATALRRAAGSATALPSVQQQLLDWMGATSDLTAVDVGSYDLIIGVGVRSPHVRAVMTRALGAVPTVLQLTAEDVPVCTMPLLRQFTLGHHLVSHWSELSTALAATLRRNVSCVTPSSEAWLDLPGNPYTAGHCDSPQYVVWAGPRPANHRHRATKPFQEVVLEGAMLGSHRHDSLVAKASAVVIGEEAGDLAVMARKWGVPVVITADCPGARWVATSAWGAVVICISELEGAVSRFLRHPVEHPEPAGDAEPLLQPHVWARWYESWV